MGKDVGAGAGRIAPRPTAIADCIARWVHLATRPCTGDAVRRILGRLVWLGRPRNTVSPVWAGTRAWVRNRPQWAPWTPLAMAAGLLEGLAAVQRGWEPSCPADVFPQAPQVYVDAAATPWGPYMVGLWGPKGARIRCCPICVTGEQSAELWGVVVALDEVRALHAPAVRLFMDNAVALAMIPWGRVRSGLLEQ